METVELVDEGYGLNGRRDGEHARSWPLNVHSGGQHVLALVVKSGKGKLYGFSVYNSSVDTVFVQLFDQSGGTPVSASLQGSPWPLPTLSTLDVSYNDTGRAFTRGCIIASSSTETTYTATSAVCSFDAQYD